MKINILKRSIAAMAFVAAVTPALAQDALSVQLDMIDETLHNTVAGPEAQLAFSGLTDSCIGEVLTVTNANDKNKYERSVKIDATPGIYAQFSSAANPKAKVTYCLSFDEMNQMFADEMGTLNNVAYYLEGLEASTKKNFLADNVLSPAETQTIARIQGQIKRVRDTQDIRAQSLMNALEALGSAMPQP